MGLCRNSSCVDLHQAQKIKLGESESAAESLNSESHLERVRLRDDLDFASGRGIRSFVAGHESFQAPNESE